MTEITNEYVGSLVHRMYRNVAAELTARGFHQYKPTPIRPSGNMLVQFTLHERGMHYHISLVHGWCPSVGGVSKSGPVISAELEICRSDEL